jgi:hypothetical protein
MRPLEKVTAALDQRDLSYRRNGSGLIAQCPAHEDRNPSLSITEEGDRVLLKCFAGCDFPEVMEALGLEPKDAFEESGEGKAAKKKAPRKPGPRKADLPSEEDLGRWQALLLGDDGLLESLAAERAWSRDALEKLGIGRIAGGTLTIAVPNRSESGELIGLIKYRPKLPAGEFASSKVQAAAGSKRELFPHPGTLTAEGPIFLLEGEADAITATSLGLNGIGIPGAQSWRKEWAEQLGGREIVIVPDCDEPGRRLAEKASGDLIAQGCEVKILDLAQEVNDPPKGFDLGDYARKQLEESDNPEADLEPLGRSLLRWAGNLEPRLPAGENKPEARKPSVPPPSTAAILEEVKSSIRRFVILPSEEALIGVSLWTLHTWAIEAAHATPYLLVVSPVMRSGKTRLVETLACLVANPWAISNPTEAILFRKLHQGGVTMLVDEVDALFRSSQERTEPIRSVLNSGTRRGSTIPRCKGDTFEVVDFEVFAAKALFGIDEGNRIPATIRDRSIEISMKRKTSDEPIERFIHRKALALLEPTRERLFSWAEANIEQLQATEPKLPESLNDRAAEGWEPLFAIADLSGPEWGKEARDAAIILSGEEEEEATYSLMALAEIEKLLGSSLTIGTAEIIEALNKEDQLPFGDWRKGEGINARALAKILKPFGIRPKKVRLSSGETRQGFHRSQLEESFRRWLSSEGLNVPEQPEHGGEPEQANPHENGDVPQVPEHFTGLQNPEPLPEHSGSHGEQEAGS